jgi:ubiquinone/menaquinone biosynthesis C-methylase UbiE
MTESMSDSHFKTMSFMFRFRDFFLPRKNVLKEVDIRPGFSILDYGCGPGSYTVVASRLVGPNGKVYALDVHPLAIKRVKERAEKERLTNIRTIQSDCATGLEPESIDVAFLYDVLRGLDQPNAVLAELHRVLKPGGTLSVNDHHYQPEQLILKITGGGLFVFADRGKKTCNFSKSKGGKG